MSAPTAAEVITRVADPGSFTRWDPPGSDGAALTGEARVDGRVVVLIVSEFGFLAGSIGVATAERITRAVERATKQRLPLVAMPASGGTRMQEGTAAFVGMLKITGAVNAHKAAGLPYVVYLRHPTTGGVLASWGSLGHLTLAEPNALVGFLGPRVYEALNDRPFPTGVQTAENLHEHGIVDAVVPLDALAPTLSSALSVLRGEARVPSEPTPDPSTAAGGARGWDAVGRSRDPRRPGAGDLLANAADSLVRLSGVRGGHGGGMTLALARIGGVPCVVAAQDRRAQRAGALIGPAELRSARRGMELASGLGLVFVSVVDTPGAELSQRAEEDGLAREIARCTASMLALPVPTLCVLLGEGCGGAALSLLPADLVVAAENSWVAPLPPEGASAITHRTTGRAAEMADAQGIGSADLLASGVVDRIVPEEPDAAEEPEAFRSRAGRALTAGLAALTGAPDSERRRARAERYRRLGGLA